MCSLLLLAAGVSLASMLASAIFLFRVASRLPDERDRTPFDHW